MRSKVIRKLDKLYGNRGQYFDAVATEAFRPGQHPAALRSRLDELMPELLDDVLERQAQ